MKYEEIKVGESYGTESRYVEKVIFKHDETRQVVTIDKYSDIYSFKESELEHLQPIKKELPESGLLVCINGFIAYRLEGKKGFGFDENHFQLNEHLSFETYPEFWRTATPEEEIKFIELLRKEADKLNLGVNAKIKWHADGDHEAFNEYRYVPHFTPVCGWNKNGCIFNNGIWAEQLVEELPETGLLINEDGTMMFRTGEESGYGFDYDDRFYSSYALNFKTKPEIWKAATKQEDVLFKSWVKGELVNRNLIKGARFKSLLQCGVIYEMGDDFSFNEDGIFSNNNYIFYQGVWAEPMSAESKTFMAKNCNNYWVETYSKLMAGGFMVRGDFSSRMDFAKETPKERYTEERIKQLEDKVEEFNSRIKGLITCFNNITEWKDKEPEKKKAWWRN